MNNHLYKTGYIQGDFCTIDYNTLSVLRECKAKCEKLIVGIPADDMRSRIYNKECGKSFEHTKELLENLKVVDEVVAADISRASMEKRFEDIRFDVCFCGIEYGRQYMRDKKYLEERGAELVVMAPDGSRQPVNMDAFREILKYGVRNRKIVLFGTGPYFEQYMKIYGEEYKPSYAVDNDSSKWDIVKENIQVRNPEVLKKEEADGVLVILCCEKYQEIVAQLETYGDFDYRPMCYYNDVALLDEYDILFFEEKEYLEKAQKALLELVRELDRVCREYQLHYYIVCGSLIGVVRHHDMIPWDDDIDVAMPRQDYEILKQHAKIIWKDSDFELCNYDEFGNNLFFDFIGRLLYMKEDIAGIPSRVCGGKIRKEIAEKKGIDIFVLDNALGGSRHKLVTVAIRAVYTLAMGHRGNIFYQDYKKLSRGARMLLRVMNKIGAVIPVKWLFLMYERLCTYARNKECQYYFAANDMISYISRLYDKSMFADGKRATMRGIEVTIPEDYDGVLKTQEYGNYMLIPPPSKRKPTHWLESRRGL